jgi:hypothetical protein
VLKKNNGTRCSQVLGGGVDEHRIGAQHYSSTPAAQHSLRDNRPATKPNPSSWLSISSVTQSGLVRVSLIEQMIVFVSFFFPLPFPMQQRV